MDTQETTALSELTKEQLIDRVHVLEQQLGQIIGDVRGFIQEHVVTLLLADRMVSSEITRNYQTQAREMFAGNIFFVVCLQLGTQLFDWNGARQAAKGIGPYRHLKQIIFEQKKLDIYPAQLYDKMVCIVNLSSEGKTLPEIEQLLLSVFKDINARLFEKHQKTADISISGLHDDIYGLPSAYRQCLRLVEYRRVYGDDGHDVMFYDHVLTSSLDFESAGGDADKKKLAGLVKRTIDSQFKNDMLNISMLADQFHVSASYITRAFKREFGLRPWEYIQKLRIKEAKDLMSKSNKDGLTVKSIAKIAGFGNASNMIRIFKRFEGETPGEHFRSITKVTPDAPAVSDMK